MESKPKKRNPAISAMEKERKLDEKWKKQLAAAESKRTPKEKAQNEYKDAMNQLGYGKTKKDVEAARKKLESFKD